MKRFLLLALAACANSPRLVDPGPPNPVPLFYIERNLDFEEASTAIGWQIGGVGNEGAGYRSELVVEPPAHSRLFSFQSQWVRADAVKNTVTNQLDPEKVRGKHVRVSGWIRTSAITQGEVSLWMRSEGPGGVLTSGQGVPVTGTIGWTQSNVAIDVPPEATKVFFGFEHRGNGTMWADLFAVELSGP